MKIDELLKPLEIEPKHYRIENMDIPVISTDLYTTLGRQLFEIYQKHDVDPQSQRKVESLVTLLTLFTLHRVQGKKSWLSRMNALFSR